MRFKHKTINNVFLVVFLLVEFLLFRSFVMREICNMVPSDVDQSVYLNQSLNMYKSIVEGDYKGALEQIFSISNTGLPVLGVVVLFLFGQSRLSLLLPNIIGFGALQVVGYKAINKIYENEHAGWGYIGILLMTNTTFGWAASVVGFRADFLFACVFAIWIILLFEEIRTENEKMYFASAVVAGFMLFIRFYSICFFIPIILIEIVLFFSSCKNVKTSFLRLLKCGCGVFIGGGWFFLANFVNFVNYYMFAMTDSMKEIWQMQLTVMENLVYYPKYFLGYHMGTRLSLCLLIMGVICLLVLGIKRVKLNKNCKKACLVLIAAFIVPYAFLMISNKQPLVISIWNGVYVFGILFFCGLVFKECNNRIINKCLLAMSIGLFLVGSGNYLTNVCGRFYGAYTDYSDKESISKIHDEITDWAIENKKEKVNVVFDRWNDILSLESFELWAEECEGKWIDYAYAIEDMNSNFATLSFAEEELQVGLRNADVIVVAKEGYNYESSFPTDQLFDSYRDDIYSYAMSNLELFGEVDWRDNELQVYVKRPVVLESEWSDWLGVQNQISFCKEEGDELLVMDGDYMDGVYPELKVQSVNADMQELETAVEVDNGRYMISIDISKLSNRDVTIELLFESFFVPSEISDSSDNRELAVLYPDKLLIKKGTDEDD